MFKKLVVLAVVILALSAILFGVPPTTQSNDASKTSIEALQQTIYKVPATTLLSNSLNRF